MRGLQGAVAVVALAAACWVLPWPGVCAPPRETAADAPFEPGPPPVGETGAPGADSGDLPLSREQAALLEQMQDIRAIRPPVPYGWDPRWAVAAVGAALLAAVAGLLWWLRRRVPGGVVGEPEAPEVPAEVLARESLAALAREAGLSDKEFYFRLCATVREFLDRRFRLDTLEMTTEELAPVLRRLPLDEALRGALVALFLASDPVRYADATVGAESRREHLAAAESAVAAAVAAAAGEGR